MIRITAQAFPKIVGVLTPEPIWVHVGVIVRSRWLSWQWVHETDFLNAVPGQRFKWCKVRLGKQTIEHKEFYWEVQMQRID